MNQLEDNFLNDDDMGDAPTAPQQEEHKKVVATQGDDMQNYHRELDELDKELAKMKKQAKSIKNEFDKDVLPNLQKFKVDLQYLAKSLKVSTSALTSIAADFVSNTKSPLDKLNKSLSDAEYLTVIPNQIEDKLNKIVPVISKELKDDSIEEGGKIATSLRVYNESIKRIKEQTQKDLNSIYTQHAEHVKNLHTSLIKKIEESQARLQSEQIELYKAEHIKFNEAMAENKLSFLKKMFLTGIAVVLTSAAVSYVVARKFPRYMEIKGANSITMGNIDNVSVYDAGAIFAAQQELQEEQKK